MSFAIALDVGLMVLLIVTIGYCWAVHRRLGILRSEQGEMRALMDQFSESTARAEAGLSGLKQTSEDAAQALTPQIEQARNLVGDLDMLNHRAAKLVGQLESPRGAPPQSTRSRGRVAPKPTAKSKPNAARSGVRSRTESDLIEALQAQV